MARFYRIRCHNGGFYIYQESCDPARYTRIPLISQARLIRDALNAAEYCGGGCQIEEVEEVASVVKDERFGVEFKALLQHAKLRD